MTLPFGETAALVLLESATRILPLAEGGHAALLGMLADVEVTRGLASSVAAGTWLAMVIVFRARIASSLREIAGTSAGHDARVVGLGSVAMVLVELAVRDRVASWGHEPMLVGAGWLVTAAAVASTLWAPRGSRDTLTLAGALLVGAVEGAGILPGLSQTGLALACLLWLGMRDIAAFEACFLLMIPAEAVLAAVRLRDLRDVASWPSLARVALSLGAGFVVLRLLRGALARRLLPAFSLYLVPLGVATIAWGYARP